MKAKLLQHSKLCTVKSAEQKRVLLGEDTLQMQVESVEPLALQIGDYVEMYGSEYTLNQMPQPTKQGERKYSTQLNFEGLQYKLIDVMYRNKDVLGYNSTGTFQLVCTLAEAMGVLINCLNAHAEAEGCGEQWELGDCPATDYKDLSFSEENCLAVLQRLCGEECYNTEFEMEALGNRHYRLHLRKAGSVFPAAFTFGKGGGVYELKRKNVDSKNVVTRLYVEGGTRNITTSYRNGAQRLRMAGESYIQEAAPVAAFGIKESGKKFDDIFPKRIGTVSSLGSTIYEFCDADMFNLNEKENGQTKWLIDGTSAKVKFLTGDCAGYELEVAKYDAGTHKFTVKPYEDSRGFKIPAEGTTAYQIKKSDTYVLLDIIMPQDPYVTDAEAKLELEGKAYYEQNCQPRVEYELQIKSLYLKRKFGSDGTVVNLFNVGDYITVRDAEIGVDKAIRIKEFARNALTDPYEYKITLSDVVEVSILERLIADSIETDRIIEINNLTDLAKARSNWRTTQELLNMVFDGDGYFDTENIKPNSIETMMLSVGNRAGQFVIRNLIIVANAIVSNKPNANTVKITSNGAQLIHYAIESTDRAWSLQSETVTKTVTNVTLNSANAYYVYAKCPKSESTGQVILSQDRLATEVGSDYYFLIGVLSSVYNNFRELTLTYGSTRITGRTINCGRIESVDKNTYFDLDNSEIGGNIKFRSTSGGTRNVNELEEIVNANTQSIGELQDLADELQQQIDGAIEYWFGDEEPTTENEPAVNWEDASTRHTHLGDIYTDTTTGLEYRFALGGRRPKQYYYWQETASTGVGQAIQTANNALTLAGTKNHVYITATFTNAQVVNYKQGDLWLALDTYKMRVCKSDAQAQDTYVAADWEPIGYTDDTAANAAQAVLDNMASDSKITPAEKLQLKTEMLNITADYTQIHAKAVAVGVTDAAYTTAYTNLNNYVSSILSNMSTTTSISRTAYNNYFSSYYTQRAAVMGAISGKQAQDAVDGLEIGQGNYINNGAFLINFNGWESASDSRQLYADSTMGSCMRFGKSNTTSYFFLYTAWVSKNGNLALPNNTFNNGTKYTLAFWARANKSVQLRVGFMNPAGDVCVQQYTEFVVGTSWQRISMTFVANGNSREDTRLYIRGEQTTTFEYLLFTKFVLVEGNKAPEWTASSAEFQAQLEANKATLQAITGNYTQIDGGLILSTFLKLGAILSGGIYQESAGVKAMLNSKDEVAAYFGGTLAEANAGKSGMTTIFHNGKLKADNVEIRGKVVSTEGEIGGFVVAHNKISGGSGCALAVGTDDFNTQFGVASKGIRVAVQASDNQPLIQTYDFAYKENNRLTLKNNTNRRYDWLNIGVANVMAIDYFSSTSSNKAVTDGYGYQFAMAGTGHVAMDAIIDGGGCTIISGYTAANQVGMIRIPFHCNRIAVTSNYDNDIVVLPDYNSMFSTFGYGFVHNTYQKKFTFEITIYNIGSHTIYVAGRNTDKVNNMQYYTGNEMPQLYENGSLKTTLKGVSIGANRYKKFMLFFHSSYGYKAMCIG